MPSSSYDEFDQLSDEIDYGAIGQDDWELYQTQTFSINDESQPEPRPSTSLSAAPASVPATLTPPTRPASSNSSTDYTDEFGDEDEDFFAELDVLEQELTRERQIQVGAAVSETGPSHDVTKKRHSEQSTGKRSRSSSDASDKSAKRLKGKEKAVDVTIEELLTDYEDEMCCAM
ncbi:hypothetical protein V5O48_002191 [Marasmius crinis-equi]|uniref:Uncharacterized protein n=1 Tax=Marasmius crinis-equi TaxID=585013 RepID=A0ABR3FW86_9AGAR